MIDKQVADVASPRPAASAPVRFERELDMHAPLAAVAPGLARGLSGARGRHSHVLFELATAAGIPDVVFVAFDAAELRRRTRLQLGPVEDVTCIRALAVLSGGPTTVLDVARHALVSVAHLRRTVLPRLMADGWIALPDRGRRGDDAVVRPLVEHRPLAACVMTVEAKRRDWRGAVAQARRHLACSDRAFIALDAAHAGPVAGFADDLAEAGIGLVTVDALSRTVELVRLPASRPAGTDADRRLVAERAWALVLAGRDTGTQYQVFGRDLSLRS